MAVVRPPFGSVERLLWEGVPDPITVHDTDGRVLRASPAACQFLGLSEDSLIGRRFSDLCFAEDRPLAESVGSLGGARVTFRIRRADGSHTWVETRTGRRTLDQGFVAVTRDVHERKKREDALARTNENLRTFTSTAAHDLKAPLSTIRGYAQLLMGRFAAGLGPDGRRHAERISVSAARLTMLVEDLLTLANLESPETTFSPVHLGAVVHRVQESLDRNIRDSGAVLEVGDLPTVFGNPVQLEHLFQNLLSNALKYRGEQSPHIQVSANATPDGDVVTIRDNGIGFPPERAAQIFEPFARLHPRERYEGSGLGLAIVSRIAEQHGGRVWAQSTPGQGSVFYTLFPRIGSLD